VIVDDDPTTTLLFRSYLEASYSVSTFNGGLKALEWIDKTPRVDLIIVDLYMPEMDGHGLVRRLREHGKTRETPVMVISGTKSDQDRIQALSSGADDFVGKPLNPDELLARIEIQLRRAKPPAVVNALPFTLSVPASCHLVYDWPPGSAGRAERELRLSG